MELNTEQRQAALRKIAETEGFATVLDLLEHAISDSVSPGICTNPDCGFNLRIDNGEISFGRAIGQSYK